MREMGLSTASEELGSLQSLHVIGNLRAMKCLKQLLQKKNCTYEVGFKM